MTNNPMSRGDIEERLEINRAAAHTPTPPGLQCIEWALCDETKRTVLHFKDYPENWCGPCLTPLFIIDDARMLSDQADPVRQSAIELVEALAASQSFEVEAGCAGEGPLVKLIEVLGITMPDSLRDWLLDGAASDNDPCDRCGEYHPAAVLDDGLCPTCANDSES